MLILGIDPGLTGAVALHGLDGLVALEDLPVSARRVDGAQLAALLRSWEHTFGRPVMAHVERQQSMPRQGVSSTHRGATNYGIVLGVVGAIGYPISEPAAGSWKRGVGLPGGADKEASRARASALMPGWAGLWPLKKHHGRAEAALIAWWGARQK